MGNCNPVHRIKKKEELIKDDPDEEFIDYSESLDSSTIQQGTNNSLNQQETETGESPKLDPSPTHDCPICMEPKNPHETSPVGACLHVFCLDCIRGHIAAKIEENAAAIRCPELNCESVVDFEFCSPILPPKDLERWGKILCESAIQTTTKLYCPFKDCSAPLLVDDPVNGIPITESECPHCCRSFCARCKVPWHSNIQCEEFQKVIAKRIRREDIMLMSLAVKKEWQRCPNCGFIVERTHGCAFMKCRCNYCFCYKCGTQISGISHLCYKCRKE